MTGGDRPYEYNASSPYDSYYENHIEHKIELKEIFFKLPYDYTMPCTGHLNSPYSVEDINNKKVPWIEYEGVKIWAETTLADFIETIENLEGIIYVPRKEK